MNEQANTGYEHFRELIENSRDIHYKQDINTREIVCFSNSSELILGYSREEIASMSHEESLMLFHPEDLSNLKNFPEDLIQADIEGKCPLEKEFRMIRKDGSSVWVHGYYILKRSDSGDPKYIVGVLKDISERKKSQEELKKSEEMLSQIFQTTPDPITIIKAETGECTYVNEKFSELIGWGKEEALGKTAADFNLWKDFRKRDVFIKGIRENGFVDNLEAEFRTKNNTFITGLISGKLINIGGQLFIVTITKDISERKKVERELSESNERFKLLSSATFEGILIHENGIVQDINESFTRITGFEKKDAIGKSLFEFFDEENREIITNKIKDKSKKAYRVISPRKDGTTFHAEIEGRTLSQSGKTIRIVAVRNISERVKDESELKEYRNKLEKLVSERTKELELKNKELERYNKLFEGREFRIKELREEVKGLKRRLKSNGIDPEEFK